jgi:ankyrin repeat protein
MNIFHLKNKNVNFLEQLQYAEKELHDKAQQHLKTNQEYRSQVNEYINSNSSSTSNLPTTAKKKRTTSSSSTSSSSSSSSSTSKHEDQISSSILPISSPTINFFSTSSIESNQSSNHHHLKIKKSSNRQLFKYDRRIEQHVNDNQTHLDEMNMHLKNLKLISSTETTTTTTTKIPMRINTDTQKGLEHLRQLASNPSTLEKIQTLYNDPNIIKKIQKFANKNPFMEQLRTLQQTTVEKSNMPSCEHDSTLISSQQHQNLTIETTDLPPPPSPSIDTRHSTCCAEHSSQLTHSSSTSLSNLRFQNRIDVDCETESNHDTALTLACAGGHEELVLLLLQRNANIEHRDKKGFTPLILAGKSFYYLDYHKIFSCFF